MLHYVIMLIIVVQMHLLVNTESLVRVKYNMNEFSNVSTRVNRIVYNIKGSYIMQNV